MGWIAVVGDGQNWVDPSLGARRMTGIDRAMRRGTIMIEADAPTLASGPALIRLRRAGGSNGIISLQWVPSQGLVLLVTQAQEVFHATLPFTRQADALRLSFSWDLDHATARLAAEVPGEDSGTYLTIDRPLPIFLSDFWSLSRGVGPSELGNGVRFIAVSEAVEPIGPLPTLYGQTLIDTAAGPRALNTLTAGDTVRSLSGETVPVLHVIKHTLPAAGSFRPVRIGQHTLGATAQLVAAPVQHLVVDGGDVPETFGAQAVRLAASHLPHSHAQPLAPAETGPLVTYYQLVLPDADPMRAHGLALESLNLGGLAADRGRVSQSLMAQAPRTAMPDHTGSPFPLLGATETLTLATVRAA